jgi:hypothetical protein
MARCGSDSIPIVVLSPISLGSRPPLEPSRRAARGPRRAAPAAARAGASRRRAWPPDATRPGRCRRSTAAAHRPAPRARMVRPPESTSRLATVLAVRSGSRIGSTRGTRTEGDPAGRARGHGERREGLEEPVRGHERDAGTVGVAPGAAPRIDDVIGNPRGVEATLLDRSGQATTPARVASGHFGRCTSELHRVVRSRRARQRLNRLWSGGRFSANDLESSPASSVSR